MYEFCTHTWSTVKGKCPHDCSYCYVKGIARRFRKPQLEAHFDEKELRTNLGSGNFIFVGSSNDLFATGLPEEWILRTLDHCSKYDNRYLFQSKNPARILDFIDHPVFRRSVVCTTIETGFHYSDHMGDTPDPTQRSIAMGKISEKLTTYVTVEPIMTFHHDHLVQLIRYCNPQQVNIGADSGHNRLPEPSGEQVRALIAEMETFTVVKPKSNLARLLK